jgi:hypothetical protein
MKPKDFALLALVCAIPVASFWAASLRSNTPAPPLPSDGRPVTVEPISGSDLHRIVLSARAAERLGIGMVPVGRAEGSPAATGTRSAAWPAGSLTVQSASPTVVPYSAVLYDANGHTWVYTSPEPLIFVRSPVSVDYIEGDRAVLAEGPAAGTTVVAVGGAELFGAELEVVGTTPDRGAKP